MKIRYIGKGLKGKGLRNSLLQKIILNTKIPNPEKDIYDKNDHYRLDTELSTRTVRIYYNSERKIVIISHSSTIANTKELGQSLSDVKDDVKMFFFGVRSTKRYKDAYKVQKAAEEKYHKAGYYIMTVGYSLGSQVSKDLGESSSNVDETIVYNKPIVLADLIDHKGVKDNTYEISTDKDITSILKPIEDSQRNPDEKKHETIIKANTKNKLDAHYDAQLKNLSDDYYFGKKLEGDGFYGDKIIKHMTRPNPSNDKYENIKQAYFMQNSGGCIECGGRKFQKMKVGELKAFIKQNRKGKANQYLVSGKNKKELILMAENIMKMKN